MIELGTAYAAQTLKLQKAFAKLEEKAQDGILRPIMTAASKVVAEAERAAAPKASGLLAEAIGVSTTRTYHAAGSTKLFIAAGVRRGFRRIVTAAAGGKSAFKVDRQSRPESGDEGARDPVKYLAMVTRGRKAVAAVNRKVLYDAFSGRFIGRTAAAVTGNPFIERAYQQIGPQVVAQIESQGQAAIASAIADVQS